MKVEVEIGKVEVEISASEDERIKDFWEFATAIIVTVCRIENERKELENISK